MRFTDLFIKKPVLATVVSLLILTLGLRAIFSLPIMQYPFTQNAVITITTAYTGADPAVVAGFITAPLENSIAQVNGIDYMTSTSTQGVSTINANLLLNYDPLKGLSEVSAKVNAVLNQLPAGSQQPTITVTVGQTIRSMYLGFYSDILPTNKITDYLIRVVQPKIQAVNGVQSADILGGKTFAMRAWLDPMKLAGFGITPSDVAAAVSRNNFISAVGRTDGQSFIQNITANTGVADVKQFQNMAIKARQNTIIRLRDVADVDLGAEDYDTTVSFDGEKAVYIGITVAPSANLLTVIQNIRKIFPDIQQQLPQGISANIVYDASAYVNASIKEVVKSLAEAFIIVTIVIFLFLGSLRAVFIPLIAIPLSIIGAFFIMFILGYSINLLTLLAMVLAIGLVVDDAIIIVENVQRHMEEGKTAFAAALLGAQELAGPIVAITIVLIAVYAPIGFMGGLTGALFTEFAFALAGAVTVSGIIALTLSPMMCSKFLIHISKEEGGFIHYIDHKFEKLQRFYERLLKESLQYIQVTLVFAVIILASNYFLFKTSDSELAPQEDQGIIITQVTAAANAALSQIQLYAKQVFNYMKKYPENAHIFEIDSAGSSILGMVFKPWDERALTTNEIQPRLQEQLNKIAGGQIAAFQPPSLPGGGGGLPIQFVITTTDDAYRLNLVTQDILRQASKSGLFIFITPDLKIDQQQATVTIDRDKAADLGMNMQDIGNILGSALSQGYINYFNYAGRSYKVIPQMTRAKRINVDQLFNYYVSTVNNTQIPLATVATLQQTVVPESINHFQQLNSATISAVAVPGVSMGDALKALKDIAAKNLPAGYSIDYAGQSRQFVQEGSALMVTFFFALIIIFLCLAALFESFRDPLIVLISVPMSICGAMIFVSLGVHNASLNIYSQVGLITLIGLISKHGILIVQFANDLQLAGKSKYEAITTAASIRLRPILMTTAAMVLGVLPLIFASGAGALSRINIGLVIATGISIGTLFTIFVVPAMYMILAQTHHHTTQE